MFQIPPKQIDGLHVEPLYVINNVIGEYVVVVAVETVKIGEDAVGITSDVADHHEPQHVVEMVVMDDELHELDAQQFDWMVEMVEKAVHFMHLDDEVVDEVVDDDEDIETDEMVEMVDIQTSKHHEHNDELVEILECMELDELVE